MNRFLSRFQPSIRIRLTIPFLVVTIIVAGLGILIVTRLVAGSIEERLGNQLADSAQTAANAFVEIERAHLDSLRLMVNTVNVDRAIQDGDVPVIDELLRPLAVSEDIDRMIVINETGDTLFQLNQLSALVATEDVSQWESVTRILGRQTDAQGDKFTDIVAHGEAVFFYTAAPVLNEAGEVIGGILVGTDMQNAVRFLSNQAVAQVTLFGINGSVLASTFPAESIQPLPSSRVNELIVEGQNTSIIDELTTEDMTYQTLYTVFRVRNDPAGIKLVALPNDFVTDRINVSRNTFATIFILLFLSVLGIGLSISRSILVPLEKLVFTTRRIRAGNLEQRVKLTTRDELGELGQSFDKMTEALVARNRRINRLYQSQLKETARRDAVLESIGDAVLVLNSDGSEYLHNEAFDTLFSIVMENPEDSHELDYFMANPDELLSPQILAISDHYYSGLARPIVTRGEVIGHVLAFRDITEIIEAENTKDEIILQISHELRTPLSAVRGYFELLNMFNQFDDKSEEFILNAGRHLDELQYMINQVIEVSAILSNRFELSFNNIDLVRLVNLLLGENQEAFAQKDIVLLADLPEKLMIRADEHRLYQTLEHVLNNARQYTLPSGKVRVQVIEIKNKAIIQVEDTGVGIKPDEIDFVFDRMYRGSAADAGETDTRGLGVGLFISQEIIQYHNGSIIIDSVPGKGTKVLIQLPRSVSAEERHERRAEQA